MYLKLKAEMHFLLVLLVCININISGGLEAESVAATRYDISNTTSNHTIMKGGVITKPGCQSKCGDLAVPYPFGIISEGGLNCSINPSFDIICNYSTTPPKAFIPDFTVEVIDISDTQLRTTNLVAERCYSPSGDIIEGYYTTNDWEGTPYTFSEANVLTVVGCDEYANMYNNQEQNSPKGCTTTCSNAAEVIGNDCSGTGCCQVPINALNYVLTYMHSYDNHTKVWPFNRCGYAFFGEKSSFNFQGASDLNDPNFRNRTRATVPIVLDWAIGENNIDCAKAAQDNSSYACISVNSSCVDIPISGGYRCSCNEGYKGNPYLNSGCQDIDECEDSSKNDCGNNICTNTVGNFTCSCRPGYSGDGRNCVKNQKSNTFVIKLVVGIGSSFILLLIGINWLCCHIKKRKHDQLKEKLFMQNGGLLLERRISRDGGTVESTKVFTDEELKKATNNYASDRILGHGGYGVVYKGILPDQRVVAIKKSKIMDKSQVEQFINEVVILTQVNHRNVVKLLGFCLECEVPMLVYEFVSNGTLFDHVHSDVGMSWLSLENRLRIAAESSGALAYLHSAASIPIFHRDVKLSNILLDDNHVAKISDFGASRLVPLDKGEVATLVQGTLGYLDPEYFQTGQLTDKSDVYSFGAVLAELLTGRIPLCNERSPEERNLATYFITSLKQNRLFQILEPRVVRDGTLEQLETAAQLVERCLSLNGEDRPTMKEVAMEIESLMKYNMHPWTSQHGHEETTNLLSNKINRSDLYEIQPSILTADSDLYGIQLSSFINLGDGSEYSLGSTSLLLPSSSPR